MARTARIANALSTRLTVLATAASLAACQGTIREPSSRAAADGGRQVAPTPGARNAPPPRVVARLTTVQYRNAVGDLLNTSDVPRVELEADTNPFLFTTIGAAGSTLSARGVDAFHRYAMDATGALFGDDGRRRALVHCEGDGAPDDACVRSYLEQLGRRAFRRALDRDELDRYVAVASATAGGDAWRGLRYATAALLSSPSFLYRAPEGEPLADRPGFARYTGFEMAERLAFVLWNSVPDGALLDAAAQGALDDAEGVRAEARRMLAAPRARAALMGFFGELFNLRALESLTRDRALYPQATSTLGGAMREDILRRVEAVVFAPHGDYRTLFRSADAYVDRELAGFYGVAYPDGSDGFVRVTLPTNSERRGLMASAGVLALTAHPTATSPTGRGRYVRERLLCQPVPDPPPEVNPSLPPDPPGMVRTMRERLERHRTDPACASCHTLTDPVGLGLENFDAIGALRTMEAGRPVDDAGDLDGVTFEGAGGLGDVLAQDARVPRCLAVQFWRYANARREVPSEQAALDAITERFARSGYRVSELIVEAVASDAFRIVATGP